MVVARAGGAHAPWWRRRRRQRRDLGTIGAAASAEIRALGPLSMSIFWQIENRGDVPEGGEPSRLSRLSRGRHGHGSSTRRAPCAPPNLATPIPHASVRPMVATNRPCTHQVEIWRSCYHFCPPHHHHHHPPEWRHKPTERALTLKNRERPNGES